MSAPERPDGSSEGRLTFSYQWFDDSMCEDLLCAQPLAVSFSLPVTAVITLVEPRNIEPGAMFHG